VSDTKVVRAVRPGLVAAVVVGLLLVGSLWMAAWVDVEPTVSGMSNDFARFHYPSAVEILETRFAALVDGYESATTPLSYVLTVTLLGPFGLLTETAMRLLHVVLGVAVVGVAFRAARGLDGAHPRFAWVVGFAVVASPYLRGSAVWANTDVVPLLLLAVWLGSDAWRGSGGWSWSVGRWAAVLAVLGRQFYGAIALVQFLRDTATGRLRRPSAWIPYVVVGAVLLILLASWGGVNPPGFDRHVTGDAFGTSVYVLSGAGLFCLPFGLAWRGERLRAFAASVTGRVTLGLAALYLAVALVRRDTIELFAGSGLVPRAIDLALPEVLVVPAMAVVATGTIVLLGTQVWQDRWNVVVPLALLFLTPTDIIYQKYLDPMLTLLLALGLRSAEADTVRSTRLAYLLLVPATAATAAGWLYYG
jgi:hypothetical protein